MKVQLVVVQGKPEGMTIPLASPRYKIGRGEGCQLRPNSDLVSREHAEFSISGETVIVQDLGSRNGTEVNGKKLAPNQPQLLKSGDLIKVGTLTFAISIEGVPTAKAAPVHSGGGIRKPSLDDISGDEIDAWLVSDESRPTPERPSGVYGGDTITLATYNGQEKPKATVPTPKPAPKPAAKPLPAAPRPAQAPPATPVVKAPVVEPVAEVKAPEVVAAPIAAQVPEPPPVVLPAVAAAPVVVPPPAPVAETSTMNPLFDFLPDDLPESESASDQRETSYDEVDEDDGIEDLSSLQASDSDENSSETMPEEFIDESNPFYVKKKEASAPATAGKPTPGAQDSSSAAGDILRKLLDRRRASKP